MSQHLDVTAQRYPVEPIFGISKTQFDRRLVYLLAKPFRDLSTEYGVQDLQVNVFGHTANLQKVIDLAAQGAIEPIIGHSLDIQDFSKAFQLGESGKAGGKIVLTLE